MSSNNYGVIISRDKTGTEKLKFVLRFLDLNESYLYSTNDPNNNSIPDLDVIEGLNEGFVSGDELKYLLLDAAESDFDSYDAVDFGNGYHGVRINRRFFVGTHKTGAALLEMVKSAQEIRDLGARTDVGQKITQEIAAERRLDAEISAAEMADEIYQQAYDAASTHKGDFEAQRLAELAVENARRNNKQ